MATLSPTYVSDGEGRVVAFHGQTVIASGTDFEKVAETAEEYFNELRNRHKRKTDEDERRTATHVVTPNGDSGVILGRTPTIYGDSITVRFANGQIRHYDTFVGDGLKFSNQPEDAPKSPVEYFQRKLDESVATSREGLLARLNDLNEIRRDASKLASHHSRSDEDVYALDSIVKQAELERSEIRDALEAIEASDAEAYVPPKRAYQAVEQADIGHKSGSWLDKVAEDMVAESEGQDFDRILQEGPTEFVAGLEAATLAHTGIVRDLAYDHITSKTAGFTGEAVEEYRDRFLAATEIARKRELTYRNDDASKTATKEAAIHESAPDEALYL